MDSSTDKQPTVSKFKVKDTTLFAVIHWKEKESCVFTMKIFDGDTVWSGSLSRESVDVEDLDETEEEYYSSVKTALTSEDALYSYDFTRITDEAARFSWKRHHEDVVIIHGTISVYKVQEENKDSLIQFLFKENKKLLKNADLCACEIKTVKNRLEELSNELEYIVNKQTEKEHHLYGKFVKLLNAKKRRIEVLEENLSNLE